MSIRVDLGGGVLRLVMDKPARGNALCPSMMKDMAQAFDEGAVAGVRVALLEGAGDRAFCTG